MRPRGPGPGWTVLVTGASSGLGRSLALELAGLGCGLVLCGRSLERLAAVQAEADAAGAPWTAVLSVDLAAPGGAEALVDATRGLGRTVDALVNNAGAARAGPWLEGGGEEDRSLVSLLVAAPLTLTRGLAPGWKARGRGAVLNVASTGAFQPGPETAVYYAAKAFLMSWSVALAREERSWLAVTTLCPGALKTGFAAAAGKEDIPGAPGPDATARKAVSAWRRGRGLVVPGIFNKIIVLASRLLPPPWTAVAVQGVQKSVRPSTEPTDGPGSSADPPPSPPPAGRRIR